MNQKITRIGFIGLGRIGKPMAINLLKSGYDVAAYDVRHEPVRDPIQVRRRRTEVFQKSLRPALALAKKLGLSLHGASLTERLLPRIMGIEEN